MKEIEEDISKWKNNIPCSGIRRVNIVTMSMFLQTMHRFDAISINSPMVFFIQIEKIILKSLWSHKRPEIAKEILRKKNKPGVIVFPDFKLYCKAIVIKTV